MAPQPQPNAMKMNVTKRKVVLPEGLSGHHSIPHHPDPWHQWEGFVVILVLLHIVVLVFYAWILYKDKKDRKDKRKLGGGRGESPAKQGAKPSAAAWRTPKDILASYQKQRLGKV